MLPVIYGIVRIMLPSDSYTTVIRNFKSVVTKKLKQQWHLNDIDPSEPSVPLLATLGLRIPSFSTIHRNRCWNHCNTSNTTTTTRRRTCSTSRHATALDILLGEDNSIDECLEPINWRCFASG